VILPEVCRKQAQRVQDIRILGVRNVRDLTNILMKQETESRVLPFSE
jgi:hypothetical protein